MHNSPIHGEVAILLSLSVRIGVWSTQKLIAPNILTVHNIVYVSHMITYRILDAIAVCVSNCLSVCVMYWGELGLVVGALFKYDTN